MFDKALELAKKGFYIFPIHKPAKDGKKKGHPCIKDQNNQATRDITQIKKWWSKWPNANIGISPAPLGAKDKLFVLDVDTKYKNALTSLNKLIALGLPKTLQVSTPSGGYHLYYKHPGGGTIKASDKIWKDTFPNIDLRGDGTFVVGPGSEIGCKHYTWDNELPIASLPLNVVGKLPYKEREWSSNGQKSLTDIHANASKFELPDRIDFGERDSTLWAYIGSLVAQKKTLLQIEKAAKEAFKRVAQSKEDPFEWTTVEAMIARAFAEYFPKPLSEVAQTAPEKLPSELQGLLDNCVLIQKSSLVADLRRPATELPLSLADWKNSHKNVWVDVKKRYLQAPPVWLAHSMRRTVYDTKYYPGLNRIFSHKGTDYYNSYIPPTLKPAQGPNYQLVLDHLDYIFDSSKEDIKLFLNWLAYTVRYPAIRIPWVPLIVGKTRTGKGWFAHLLMLLLGEENCYPITPVSLSDNQITYNEFLGGTLLWIDDIEPSSDFYDRLKSLITEKYLTINQKYGKKEKRQIFCNVIATSNHRDALKLTADDGRWWVFHSKAQRRDQRYYTKIFNWLESDGPAHFLYYIIHLDVSQFKYAEPPPMTRAKTAMIDAGKSEVAQAISNGVEFKQSCFAFDIVSFDAVSIMIRHELALDNIGRYEKSQISKILSEVHVCDLPQLRYAITVQGRTKRLQLYCIRNPEKWSNASQATITVEYEKAIKKTVNS